MKDILSNLIFLLSWTWPFLFQIGGWGCKWAHFYFFNFNFILLSDVLIKICSFKMLLVIPYISLPICTHRNHLNPNLKGGCVSFLTLKFERMVTFNLSRNVRPSNIFTLQIEGNPFLCRAVWPLLQDRAQEKIREEDNEWVQIGWVIIMQIAAR